ncbi:MAG: phospholipase D-like domain-containing protein [Ignavibacteriae bacterium]|nr:phospholipase D-like domain-containing protein [Ignavibacteriota bacterium]
MNTRKKVLLFSIYILLFTILGVSGSLPASQGDSRQDGDFTLVESVPVEISLEQSKLPRALDVWLDMISNAQESIDIETFYIANEKGEVLEQVLKAIKDAASRGVQVRVMIDESFYNSSEKSADELNNIPNIIIRKIPIKKIAGGVMHAKYFVVDKKDLFIGSQNMDWRALKHIHEMGVMIKSKKMARVFLNIFEIDWGLCENYSGENLAKLKKKYAKNIINSRKPIKIKTEEFGDVILYPAFSPAGILPDKFNKEETELLKIIKKTKSRLCINMFSYSLKGEGKDEVYDKIDKALRDAASRGVKIKIIFSNWTIKKGSTESIQSLSTVPNIEIKFSNIPEYSGGFIPYSRVDHSKYFISDRDISWISTSNWERSYFYECRNATLIIQNEEINSLLEEDFLLSWNSMFVENVDPNKIYTPIKRK